MLHHLQLLQHGCEDWTPKERGWGDFVSGAQNRCRYCEQAPPHVFHIALIIYESSIRICKYLCLYSSFCGL